MTIEASDDDPSSSVFKMDGFISNSNYIAKKITMVLFINGTWAYSTDAVELTGTICCYLGLSSWLQLCHYLNATTMGYDTSSWVEI